MIIRKQISCLRKVLDFEEQDRSKRLESDQQNYQNIVSGDSSLDYNLHHEKQPGGTFESK